MAEVMGYVIRHPGLEKTDEFTPVYIFGRDPNDLKEKFFEGFNPVMECRRYWPKPPVKCASCGHEREESAK